MNMKHKQNPDVRRAHQKRIRGIISVTSKASGYVPAEGFEEDIEIPAGFLNTALHGDTVEVGLRPRERGARASGEVLAVVSRAKETFIGVVEKRGEECHVMADDRRMYADIVILKVAAKDLQNGQKVLVHLEKWDDPQKNPEGRVIKVLGQSGDTEVEMAAITLAQGFEMEYSAEVIHDAEKLQAESKEKEAAEILKRRDFRDIFTFTIDPADAKDFDDAISYEKKDSGTYEIGVHIADVSYYVKEGGALDREARKRGTSVYMIDRVVPMLPEIISNDLCSLNPHENKMTFSAVFTFSKEGVITDRWFGRTVINSNHRFTYETAQEGINTKSGLYAEELIVLNQIAKDLRKKRFEKGAIAFAREEIKFKLDENGKLIGATAKEHLDTHELVEEFMLLANSAVAHYLFHAGKTENTVSLFRIHSHPDREKIEELYLFMKTLGHSLPRPKNVHITQQDINALLKKVEGEAEEGVIKNLALASMAKAIYSTKNIGHFGLAFQYYTHFTSPIRRYPDLIVQRMLAHYLAGNKISESEREHYERMAMAASEREIGAVAAERASIRYKQAEYMRGKVGQIFTGTISGVTEWGIYVEEQSVRAEGMVKLRDLKDDFYVLDAANYRLVGQRKKKVHKLGDKVRVKLMAIDPLRRTLDFVFA